MARPGRRRSYTPEQEQQILAAYARGDKVLLICKAHTITSTVLARILCEHHIPRRRTRDEARPSTRPRRSHPMSAAGPLAAGRGWARAAGFSAHRTRPRRAAPRAFGRVLDRGRRAWGMAAFRGAGRGHHRTLRLSLHRTFR